MVKNKKDNKEMIEEKILETTEPLETKVVTPNDLDWTDHVLGLLSEDEKISGNPTTDGLRRIFEKALNCRVLASVSNVVQTPEPNNEKRATVVHSITYFLNEGARDQPELNTVTINGAADVFWGNCDKVYRNYPVAVAETRAEGRALRRALKLRKVVAAEEIAAEVDDHPDQNTVSKISNNQINFIDVMSKRLNINVSKLLETDNLDKNNVYGLNHEDAIGIIRQLSKYQQDMSGISEDLLGYTNEWK
jgi:hypothetical protein